MRNTGKRGRQNDGVGNDIEKHRVERFMNGKTVYITRDGSF